MATKLRILGNFYKVPALCPSCKKECFRDNKKRESWGGESWSDVIPTWKLIAGESYTEVKFDSAHTLYGSTTAFYNTTDKVKRTIQCPHCGYIHIL